jgi:glucosamine 6-phosphate synthetase-like amidotransferase/phosphosugar isomerase protein
MCGIFGSHNFRRYEKLYLENKQRGTFSYGSMYLRSTHNPGYVKETHIRKREGVVDLIEDYVFSKDYESYLGHTQAPTSATRDFSPVTSHPFNSLHYVVAHNGVLENMNELVEKYLKVHDNPVDSSIIPILLSYQLEFNELMNGEYLESNNESKTPDIMAIEHVCRELKGIFSCWIHSKLSGGTYLVRNGSTLFGNIETGDFSSVPVPGLCEQELQEGVIYCFTSEGLARCGEFSTNSSFFL